MAEANHHSVIVSERGQKLLEYIKNAYKWKEEYSSGSQEFLQEMGQLFFKCQKHMTQLSSSGSKQDKKEVDAIVEELLAIRKHWGPELFPQNMTALARESIQLTLGGKEYRIDSAQYFEPIPYYEGEENFGELMKLYRFSVYDIATNKIIFRYFLERSNVIQLHHVLCYTNVDTHGQIKPYGSECPNYWDQREQVLMDMKRRYDNN